VRRSIPTAKAGGFHGAFSVKILGGDILEDFAFNIQYFNYPLRMLRAFRQFD